MMESRPKRRKPVSISDIAVGARNAVVTVSRAWKLTSTDQSVMLEDAADLRLNLLQHSRIVDLATSSSSVKIVADAFLGHYSDFIVAAKHHKDLQDVRIFNVDLDSEEFSEVLDSFKDAFLEDSGERKRGLEGTGTGSPPWDEFGGLSEEFDEERLARRLHDLNQDDSEEEREDEEHEFGDDSDSDGSWLPRTGGHSRSSQSRSQGRRAGSTGTQGNARPTQGLVIRIGGQVFRSEEEISAGGRSEAVEHLNDNLVIRIGGQLFRSEEEIAEAESIVENQFVSISDPTELERIENLAVVEFSKRQMGSRQVRQLSKDPVDENGNHRLIKLHESETKACLSVGYTSGGGLSGVIPQDGSISTKVRKGCRWQYVDKLENAKHHMPPLIVVDSNGNLVEEFLDRAMETYENGLNSGLSDDDIAIVVRNHDTVLDPTSRPPKVLRFETYVVDKSQADDNGNIPLPPHWRVQDSNYFGGYDKKTANEYHDLTYGGEEAVIECNYKLFVYDMGSGKSFIALIKCKLMHLLKEVPLCHHIAKHLAEVPFDANKRRYCHAMGKLVDHGAHDTGYKKDHIRASTKAMNILRNYCKMLSSYRDSEGREHYVRICTCGHQGGGYCVRVGVFGFSFYLNTIDQIGGALECEQIKWDETEGMRVIKEGLELIRDGDYQLIHDGDFEDNIPASE